VTRRAAVLVALAASFLPVPAPAADASVPVVRVGAPLAGEAPAASLLRPATMRATFRVPPADTALYVGTAWFVRDLTVTVVGPGARRRTLAAAADLPGRMLGLRLPPDAWQADRIELEAGTVSAAAPPYLLTAEQLASIAWRTWWYAAVFGALAALALVHGVLAATLRSRACARLAAALAAQAGLTIPWLGIVRPPPEISQPLHAVLQSLLFVALTLFAFGFAGRVRFARGIRFAVWSLVALNAAAVAGGDVMQDLWPMPDILTQAALAALDLAFVAIAVAAARSGVAGARYYLAATALATLGFAIGAVPADIALLQAAPLVATALAAPLLALALFAQRESERERHGDEIERDRERDDLAREPDLEPDEPRRTQPANPAHVDGLTGIANRPALDAALATACEQAAAAQAPLAALLVDIDHFHRYNDHYGHHAGDDVLRRIAAALTDATSHHPGALAGRYSGKEFLALLPHAGLPTAKHVANSVLAAIDALEIAHGGAPLRRLTASIGVAAITPSNQTTTTAAAQDLLRRTNTAAYIAKAMGRARVVADEPVLAPPPEPEAARC
jgi:diguanylate cyclase (GGDEF)-like protein